MSEMLICFTCVVVQLLQIFPILFFIYTTTTTTTVEVHVVQNVIV
jgi:hypothetical protein